MNFDYINGTVEMFLNGNQIQQKIKKSLSLPVASENLPLIVRFGRYYYDDTPLIGKVVNINMWNRQTINNVCTQKFI